MSLDVRKEQLVLLKFEKNWRVLLDLSQLDQQRQPLLPTKWAMRSHFRRIMIFSKLSLTLQTLLQKRMRRFKQKRVKPVFGH